MNTLLTEKGTKLFPPTFEKFAKQNLELEFQNCHFNIRI